VAKFQLKEEEWLATFKEKEIERFRLGSEEQKEFITINQS